MFPSIEKKCKELQASFSQISEERKGSLEKIAAYISDRKLADKATHIVYICTHNSRRSHFGQVWAQTAANFYNKKNVYCYSGGTEVTSFNTNPMYFISFDDNSFPSMCFSKKYNDVENPVNDFLAIMTCNEADMACPLVTGADLRVTTAYEDPKAFDGTDLQDAKYDERCSQIALETLYLFSKVK
jgi:protein-tyrosine-phosphatase